MDEYVERTIQAIAKRDGNRDYDRELQNLIMTFGKDTWNRLEERSQTFLVSAKITFAQLINMPDIVDYSGVCLLVTKALEVEAGKRFCTGFVNYMKEKYPWKQNKDQYPTALISRFDKPLRPKDFTLGTLAYILCYYEDEEKSEEQKANNMTKLLEYAKAKLFPPDKSEQDINATLAFYAEEIESVKNDYRNPAAHTNELTKINAQECFDLVIDVQKLLKKMLESFII